MNEDADARTRAKMSLRGSREELMRTCDDLEDLGVEPSDLSWRDWIIILTREIRNEEFESQCDWNSIPADGWVEILLNSHRYDDECDWRGLQGCHLVDVLSNRPELASKRFIDRLSGSQWGEILSKAPRLAGICDWRKMSRLTWLGLLRRHPGMAIYLDRWALSDEDRTSLEIIAGVAEARQSEDG